MSSPEQPTLARRILRIVVCIIFAAAAVKNFVDREIVLGVVFLVVSAIFAGSVVMGGRRGSDH